MNKLRLVKIYEFRGKIHPIESFFIDILEGMKVESNSYFNDYRKNNNLYMYINTKNNNICIDYNLIGSVLVSMFKCEYEEASVLSKYILEKHLNKNFTTLFINDIS